MYLEVLDYFVGVDLFIVNIGGGDLEEEWDYILEWLCVYSKILEYYEVGKLIFGLYIVCNIFCDWDLWLFIFGGKWVLGVSGYFERFYVVFEFMLEVVDYLILCGVE